MVFQLIDFAIFSQKLVKFYAAAEKANGSEKGYEATSSNKDIRTSFNEINSFSGL